MCSKNLILNNYPTCIFFNKNYEGEDLSCSLMLFINAFFKLFSVKL